MTERAERGTRKHGDRHETYEFRNGMILEWKQWVCAECYDEQEGVPVDEAKKLICDRSENMIQQAKMLKHALEKVKEQG